MGSSRVVFPRRTRGGGEPIRRGHRPSWPTVLDELFTLPFFSRRRLVIVEDADTFVTKYRKDLEAYVEKPSASGTLLLQVKQWTSTTKLAKLVDKPGLAIDCTALRERTRREDRLWLTQYARTRCDAQLDAGAANLLVELAGLEVGILAAEVEKLAVYAGRSRRIERGDVAKMVGAGRVETIWKALDAATTGQADAALELLDNLLAAGEIPTPLLAAMSASLLKIHHAGRLRAARLNLDEACRIAGIPPFAIDKTGETTRAPRPAPRRSAPGDAPASRPRPQGRQRARPPRRPGTPPRRSFAAPNGLNGIDYATFVLKHILRS